MRKQHCWIVGLFALGFGVFGGLGYLGYTTWVDQNAERWALLEQQKTEAHSQVEIFAGELHKDRNGHKYLRWGIDIFGKTPNDPWGQPLVVRYQTTGVLLKGEKLIVTSVGPDGTLDTGDDIKAERSTR